ncbi:MAG: AAA family ATPase [Clostridia bacterium]
MERIAIMGSPGSGKSTLSRELGKLLDLPVYHLDRIYWNPGWEPTPRSRFRRRHREILELPRWIIDGHYAWTLEERLAAADTAVYLDYPRWTCLKRALGRVLCSGPRPDMAEDCPEGIDKELLSFLGYIWKFRSQKSTQTQVLLERAHPRMRILHFKSPREAERFLRELRGD